MRITDLFRRARKRSKPKQAATYLYVDKTNPMISLSDGDLYTRAGKCMNIPIFAEAVEHISDTIASMPVKLYHCVGDKIVEKTNDKRIILLNVDTKSGINGYQFKKRMIKDYLLYGGGYAGIRKDSGEVDGLFYVTPQNISISNIEERLFFRPYKIRIGATEFEPYRFLKVLRNSTNGVSGTGMVEEFETALLTLYKSLEYTRVDITEGGINRGMCTLPDRIAPDRQNEIIGGLIDNLDDVCKCTNRHIGVSRVPIDFFSLVDGYVKQDLTERIKMIEKSMRSLLHIKDDFYETFREAIFPVIKAFEAALNMDLLSTDEQSNYFFEIDTSEVLKANIKERYDAHKTAIESGIKTINEVRADENLAKIEGLDRIKVGLGGAFYSDNKIHVVNTGETINLASQAQGEKPVKGGEKNGNEGTE